MSAGRILAGIGVTVTGGVLGGAVVGGISAACGAASGATGAAILTAAGHAGHSVIEATQMSAAGNGVLGGSIGALAGLAAGGAAAVGLFSSSSAYSVGSKHKDNQKSSCCGGIAGYVATQVVGGMIGYGVLMNVGTITESFGNYVADVAVGSAVTAIPISIGLVCCFGIVAAAAVGSALAAAKVVEACSTSESASSRPGV